MFQLVSKALSYASGAFFDEVSERKDDADEVDNDEDERADPASTPPTNKNFSGTVTCFFNGRGLIDDDVYFTQDVILGNECPSVGCAVDVVAVRGSTSDGWRATRVTISEEDWTQETAHVEHTIAQITYVRQKQARTNRGMAIDLATCHHDFTPHVGDWVNLKLRSEKGSRFVAESFSALRTKQFEGKVSALTGHGGVIDDHVVFTHDVCNAADTANGTGQKVTVTAIESTQREYMWRAISVHPVLQQRDEAVHRHLNGLVKSTSSHLQKLFLAKNGIEVAGSTEFGDVCTGSTSKVNVAIRNSSTSQCTLNGVVILGKDSQFRYVADTPANKVENKETSSEAIFVDGDSSLTVEFELNARHLGTCKELVVFQFTGFEIGCYLHANVIDPRENSLKASSAFVKNKKRNINKLADCLRRNGKVAIIPGQKPERRKKVFLPKRLDRFPVPDQLRNAVEDDGDLIKVAPELEKELTIENYSTKMSTLLHIEEVKRDQDMQQYDLFKVMLRPCRDLFALDVPGLTESRPSILIGDKIHLSLCDADSKSAPLYEGFVHEITGTEVRVKFNNSFHRSYENGLCDVSFFGNRTPIRRCHQAVGSCKELTETVMFPFAIPSKVPLARIQVPKDLFNKCLNHRQMAAVRRIVAGVARPAPYLLFGPPGTGKTVTLVEAALQILHKITSSRLLLCAPSNSAADLIAERLHLSGAITGSDMVRLIAFQRVQPVPECIEKYATRDTDELGRICQHRIVICTCSMVGLLLCWGLKVGHFTHVLIDEAGQATEPECMIGVAMAAGNPDAQIVLAGDHCQLGAVLQSPVAAHFGLDISLLERLMARRIYRRNSALFSDHGSYDPLLVTKLVQNYRSHVSILRLYSKLFYDDELVACGDKEVVDACVTWKCLLQEQFTILFHGIRGEEMREGSNPSWFNPSEAVQIFTYVKKLLSDTQLRLNESDIGVITPYRGQVKKIRLLLGEVGFDDIKVGSVEEFQGQEKKVIILSTVRSDENAVQQELRHCLGFLSNPRRFNVAISRAQALLVVLGNPHILCLDQYWCCLIQYCVSNGSFIGSDLPTLDTGAMRESFASAISLLGIRSSSTEETESSQESKP